MPTASEPVRVGVTLGDPNGIGPEVFFAALKAWADLSVRFVVYGPGVVLRHYAGASVEAVDTSPQFAEWAPGQPSRAAGTAAFEALEGAVAALKAGRLDALVTLPIDKSTIYSERFRFAGHTEYLAEAFGAEVVMLMVHGPLRVGLVTGHVPLSRVSAELSEAQIVRRLRVMAASLRSDFGISQPRIGVLGVNPHAGDQGLLGDDEARVIAPALAQARAEGIDVSGPHAADGFFQYRRYESCDAVLAMYHDQGLVPFKTLAGGRGVNFTAGLPVIRTSPDHGTAYDIAGKGVADASSTADAIALAVDLARRRRASRLV